MIFVFLASVVISLISIFLVTKITKKLGIVGIDINKQDQRVIPESAGVGLAIATAIGFSVSMATNSLDLNIVAVLALGLCFAVLGFIDDSRNKFLKKSMSWKLRAVAVAIVSLGFAGFFFQDIAWIIAGALFIAGIASLQNTFAGLNGWEIGSGFIISIFLAISLGSGWLAVYAWIFSGSILGLLALNMFPAKVFPGDSGTLFIGAVTAGIAVASGQLSKILLVGLFYLPHAFDFFVLKLLTNPGDVTQQKQKPYRLLEDGKLGLQEKGKLDFAKLVIKLFGEKKEWQIVSLIWLIVSVNCILWSYLIA